VQAPPARRSLRRLRRAGPPRRALLPGGLIVCLAGRAAGLLALAGNLAGGAHSSGPDDGSDSAAMSWGRMVLFGVQLLRGAGDFLFVPVIVSWINGPVPTPSRASASCARNWACSTAGPVRDEIAAAAALHSGALVPAQPVARAPGPGAAASSFGVARAGARAVIGLAGVSGVEIFSGGHPRAPSVQQLRLYLGELPFWSFVNTTRTACCAHCNGCPWRAQVRFRADPGMLLLLFTAPFSQRGLAQLFQKLI